MQDRGYTTLTQALSHTAGLSFTRNGGLGGNSAVYLRGLDSKNTLVLIDGIRYNDVSSLSGAPYANLMLENIAQIEVIKGAQSGIWGADASAGVINIISKKATQGFGGSAHIEMGSFSTQKYGASLSQKTDAYSLKVSHNVIDTDGFTAQAPKGEDLDNFEDDGYTNKTTQIQAGITINQNNKIDISYTLIDTQGQYDTFENPNALATYESKNYFTSINYNHIDSFHEFNLYAKRSSFAKTFKTDFSTDDFDGKVDELGFNSKIAYGDAHFLLLGAEYKKFEHDNAINQDFDNQGLFITNHNVFAGFMGGKTIFTQSLRYDAYSSFDNELTGKIGLKHIHAKIAGLVTSINYGTAYTVPTLYQLYAPASSFGGVSYPVGNVNLQAETTKSYDITIAYKDLSVSYFNNNIDNLIQYTSGYNNVKGTSKIDGIEATYAYSLSDSLLLNMNYTHLFTAQDQEGNLLLRRAKDTFNIALDYYASSDLHLGIDASYIGDRTDIIFNPDFSTSDTQTGNYTLVNFTVDYQINDALQIYAKIENLGDIKYQTVYDYTSSPRAFYGGLRATF
ncbi:MAG: TonB-dependent receptor [Sulfurovum sp.]|nr:TonB-dependent receptor [Sulfurovum sp.]